MSKAKAGLAGRLLLFKKSGTSGTSLHRNYCSPRTPGPRFSGPTACTGTT